MRIPRANERWRGPASGAVDWSIAVVLAIVLELELALRRDVDGPVAVNVLAALAVTLPLAWRRRSPQATVLAYVGVAVVQEAVGGDLFAGVPPPIAGIVAGVVAFYALGAHVERDRTAAIGAGLGILGLWASVLVSGELDAQSFLFPAGLIVAAPWLAGRAQRARSLREAALRDLTVQMAREQEQRERLAASEERARIARELHDVVAHSMGVMVVQAHGARSVLDREPERAREALRSIEDTGRAALAEVRRSLGILRGEGADAALAPQPGLHELDALVEHAREAGLAVEVDVEGDPSSLAAGVDLSAYRIVQEALTNTIRHAGAAHVRLAIRCRPDELELEVADDGRGPSANGHDGAGHGLVGMRERVALYGGDLRAGPGDRGGFAVRARIPIGP